MENVQAIIMAGGEGVRLRPLTVYRPKPLVPLLGEPVMGYTLRLLKMHGITDVGATLWYRSRDIREAFGSGEKYGVRLTYYEENVQVGTAGSVAMARDHLKGTFAVLSGDGLTDCDLQAAIRFHREKKALATLVLKRVHVPLPYGVVMCGEEGRVRKFLEKPAWSRVFSNLVNTGIYILEKEIFDHIPRGGASDFGKDIFPALVQGGLPVYGFETAAYWCDVGDINAYLTAQGALLRGETAFTAAPFIHPSAQIDPEAVIGKNCFIGPDARIGPGAEIMGSSIGPGCTVAAGARIENACLWDRAAVGEKARVKSAVLCTGAAVRRGADISGGCALGEGAATGEYARLLPGVKLWPYIKALPGATVEKSLVETGGEALQWTEQGACCDSSEAACAIIRAYAAAEKPERVLVGCAPGEEALCRVVSGALAGQGAEVWMEDGLMPPMLRFLIPEMGLDGGAYIQPCLIRLFDGLGRGIPSRARERISAQALKRDSRAEFARNGSILSLSGAAEMYLARIAPRGDKPLFSPIAVACRNEKTLDLIRRGFQRMRVKDARVLADERVKLRPRETAFFLDETGERLRVETEDGPIEDAQKDMLLLKIWQQENGRLYDGPNVPRAAAEISPLLPRCDDPLCAGQEAMLRDGVAALFMLCAAMKDGPLDKQARALPETHVQIVSAPCLPRDKGRVLRALCSDTAYPHTLGEGVRIHHEKGCATIVPDGFRDQVRVTSESADSEFARELCDFYLDRIKRIINTP